MSEEFLSIREVAGELKISVGTIAKLVRTGEIPSLHFGRQIRIPRSGLDRMAAEVVSPAEGRSGSSTVLELF